MATTVTTTSVPSARTTTTSSGASYDLESGAYAGMPSLVGTAMGPARSWFSGALEWVCGEPDTLIATGQQYAELGRRLGELSGSLATAADGLPAWQGPAATRFHATLAESVDVLDAVGGFVAHTDQILQAAAEVAVKAADAIWDLVTELVGWLCTTLVKALAASTVSMGSSIAAWLSSAVAQIGRVVGVVAQLCGKVGRILTTIMGLLQKLAARITRYKDLLAGLQQVLTTVKEFSARFGEVSDGVPGQGPSWQAYRDADPTQRAALFAPTTPNATSPYPTSPNPTWAVPTGSSPLPTNGGAPWTPGFTQAAGAGSAAPGSAPYVPTGVSPAAPSLPGTPSSSDDSVRPPAGPTIGGVDRPQPYRPTVDGTRAAGVDPNTPPAGPSGYRPDVSGLGGGGWTPPSGGGGAGGGWTPSSGGSSGGGWTAPSGGGLGAGVPRPGSIDPGSLGAPSGAGSPSVGAPGPRLGSGAGGVDPSMAPFLPLSAQQRKASGTGVPLTERDEAWSESATDREAAQAMGTRAAGIDPPAGVGGVGAGAAASAPIPGLPQASGGPVGPGGPSASPLVDPLPRVTGSAALPTAGTGSGAAMAPPPLTPGRRDERSATGAAKPVSDRTTDLIDLVEGDDTEEPRHG